MSNRELQILVDEYNEYKKTDEIMGFKRFLMLFDELLRRYEANT